jgi:hypothetical protein
MIYVSLKSVLSVNVDTTDAELARSEAYLGYKSIAHSH